MSARTRAAAPNHSIAGSGGTARDVRFGPAVGETFSLADGIALAKNVGERGFSKPCSDYLRASPEFNALSTDAKAAFFWLMRETSGDSGVWFGQAEERYYAPSSRPEHSELAGACAKAQARLMCGDPKAALKALDDAGFEELTSAAQDLLVSLLGHTVHGETYPWFVAMKRIIAASKDGV